MKRFWAAVAGIGMVFGGSVAGAADLKTVGDEKAPATIYLFSSFTCPHCAHYHEEVLPTLKERFIKTGKAKLVFVDMAYDARAMAGAMLSRCVAQEQYEALLKVLYENQGVWAYGDNPKQKLIGYARLLGMSETDVNRCLADKKLQQSIKEQRDNLARLYNVQGMPTTVLLKQGVPQTFVGADANVVLSGLERALD